MISLADKESFPASVRAGGEDGLDKGGDRRLGRALVGVLAARFAHWCTSFVSVVLTRSRCGAVRVTFDEVDHLVAALPRRWGTRFTATGKRIWTERTPPRGTAPPLIHRNTCHTCGVAPPRPWHHNLVGSWVGWRVMVPA
ncbi:hypothetical protein GCM10009577_64900 [Streptomyces javensis]